MWNSQKHVFLEEQVASLKE